MMQYLMSVVPAEIGRLDESRIEALKAQAVASRSFAMARMFARRSSAYDMSAGTGDQVYKGKSGETPAAQRAVLETLGECLLHRGEVITAFYHSCCGGRTADPKEVWGEEFADNNKYLKSAGDGGYDRESKWSSWTVKWTRRQLLDQIKKYLPGVIGVSASGIGEPSDIEIMTKGPSGRNTLLKVITDQRVFKVEGDKIRRVLRRDDGRILPSTWFDLSVRREKSGAVIVAQGRGFGHGLGLCQVGAAARAADGQSYRSILKHYYKGVSIARMY